VSDLGRWPGEERRRPPRSSATWAVREPLAAWLGSLIRNFHVVAAAAL